MATRMGANMAKPSPNRGNGSSAGSVWMGTLGRRRVGAEGKQWDAGPVSKMDK